ncbi:MAG: diacylglycerol kinase [Nitrospirae bacterium]|nr:diacylglycerol kinase [Nitrospirota bacterium]
MPIRRFIESTNNAIEGIIYSARTQRHLRYHLFAAAFVLLLTYIIGIERKDFLIISIVVILVLLSEMINTAIEYVVDMLSPEYSEKARIAKDVAAGAVFITAFGAVVVGYIVLFPYIKNIFDTGIAISKHSKEEVALISIILVLISIVVLKAHFGKGHPLHGGMPSGHAAIAFSFWVAITYITESFTASIFCFILAILISQSRVAVRAHSPLEVIIGAVLGAVITLLLFTIFY